MPRVRVGHGRQSMARIGAKRKRVRLSEKRLTLKSLHQSLASLELGNHWHDLSPKDGTVIQVCEVQPQSHSFGFSKCLLVRPDLSWTVSVYNSVLEQGKCPTLHVIPNRLTISSFALLLKLLQSLRVCCGNQDLKYVEMCEAKGGKIQSHAGKTVAYLNSTYPKTVRSHSCLLLIEGKKKRCYECDFYRCNLRSIYSNYMKKKEVSMMANYRYLSSPQKTQRLKLLKRALMNKKRQLQRMKKKLDGLTAKHGVVADDSLQSDLEEVLAKSGEEINKLPMNDFKRVFWEQQTAAYRKSKKGNRWHPLFIRWCLNIMLSSPWTYDIIRDSGFICLPSKRTLRDYTNCTTIKAGFQHNVFADLIKEAKIDDLPEWKRLVNTCGSKDAQPLQLTSLLIWKPMPLVLKYDCIEYMVLAFDEMKVKEDIVFNRSGDIVGFVSTSNMDDKIREFEKKCEEDQIATHVLALMVRGIFLKFDYQFAQFPTRDLTGLQLHDIIWGAVRRLLEIGIHVICLVCDGGKPNQKFLRNHVTTEGTRNGIVYKVRNMYEPTAFVYFMSDVPHLIKTTRNCWANSCTKGTRYLWNNDSHILWAHLHHLREMCSTQSGLFIGNKLTYEHLHLNSYSRMKVKLAAQVLSKSVADAFAVCRDAAEPNSLLQSTTETEKFCRYFDKFFDCLNTRSIDEAKLKRKPDLRPYYSSNDSRLTWLLEEFIGYLDEWERSVKARKVEKVPKKDKERAHKNNKKRMLLSKETRDGLRMTVYSFVEIVPYLLNMSGPKFILSARFNQDPLEIYFSKQRARGGRNSNPSVNQFLQNVQAIRIGKSLSFGHCSNIEKRQLNHDIDELSKPLAKRRALRHQHD